MKWSNSRFTQNVYSSTNYSIVKDVIILVYFFGGGGGGWASVWEISSTLKEIATDNVLKGRIWTLEVGRHELNVNKTEDFLLLHSHG